jgi:glycosyltransferase involved in cell wall biosynthesis
MKIGGISASLYNLIDVLHKENSTHEIELFLFNPILIDKYRDLGTKTKIHYSFLLSCLFINFKEAKFFYKFPKLVIYILLKVLEKIIGTNYLRKLVIRNIYFKDHYDVAISFSNDIPLNNVFLGSNYFVQKVVNAKTKIAWIHNDLDKLGMTRNYILSEYALFDQIINVSQSCRSRFEDLAPEYKFKSFLLGNFIDQELLQKKANEFNPYSRETTGSIIVTVARIDNQQKRIDRILKVAKNLLENEVDFRWYIIGAGPDLENLKIKQKNLGLENYVLFEGYQHNPFPYIKNADIFVLTSSYEAQGMVLSESLLLGTPVITTNFPAAYEFVKDGINGVITENNSESLFRNLLRLLKNDSILYELKMNLIKNENINSKSNFLSKFNKLIGF